MALVAAPTCSLSHPVILDGKVGQATITRRTPTLHIVDIDRSLKIVGHLKDLMVGVVVGN